MGSPSRAARSGTSTVTAPRTLRSPRSLDELFAQGRITHHPVFPAKEGPAARAITSEDYIPDVIALLRLNYDRVVERYGLPEETKT